jgi:regulator of cell morphogenesis and NO signaling
MVVTPDTTVRDIVVEDYRAAAVFYRHGIDFCCGGARTLADACRERQLDPADVIAALARERSVPGQGLPRHAEWSTETLIAYIVSKHHAYVRSGLPAIAAHLRKIVAAHGGNHPELRVMAEVFEALAGELTTHMAKEEKILFPYISAMADAVGRGDRLPVAPFGSVDNPIRMMEDEHDRAGSLMARIRDLSAGYAPPADGCTTYRVCFRELAEFERDLHAHVHLENNVLFPKARALAQRAFVEGLPCERLAGKDEGRTDEG